MKIEINIVPKGGELLVTRYAGHPGWVIQMETASGDSVSFMPGHEHYSEAVKMAALKAISEGWNFTGDTDAVEEW